MIATARSPSMSGRNPWPREVGSGSGRGASGRVSGAGPDGANPVPPHGRGVLPDRPPIAASVLLIHPFRQPREAPELTAPGESRNAVHDQIGREPALTSRTTRGPATGTSAPGPRGCA